ncbi:MAG: hypothetical protein J6586_03795 [Snodgrassella sp.]|jgi:ABC-type lipoprotein release transport system permease subunit|nr:hypothetical protein [Snodgrassella sp.]
MNKKIAITIFVLIVSLISSNGFWVYNSERLKGKIAKIQLSYAQEDLKREKEYVGKLEYQRELTKSSIETVVQETNLYMNLNEQLQGEYDVLQKDMDALLKSDECGNSNIADDVRRRLFSTN